MKIFVITVIMFLVSISALAQTQYDAKWKLPTSPHTGDLARVDKTLYVALGDSIWHETRGYRYVGGKRVRYIAGEPRGRCDSEGYTVLSKNDRRVYRCQGGNMVKVKRGQP